MNSQNTPIHIRLWHHDFWRMAIANLLLTMAVYMLVPTMPLWLMSQGFSCTETGIAMGAFGVGLFVLGGFVSFLVQHYRRNMVCIWSAACMALLLGLSYYFETRISQLPFYVVVLQRFLFGVVFGLAQMVLASTLIIDTCESYQRTEANHSASWFGRFALSLGPIAGILTAQLAGFGMVLLTAACLSAIAVILISLVHFPFRAPQDDVPSFSLDRFFLPHGFPLFVNLQLIMLAVGLLFSLSLTIHFYGMMMAGFLSALLAQRFIFRDAEVKSEVVSGLILMGAALLMMLTRTQQIVAYAAPLFVGVRFGYHRSQVPLVLHQTESSLSAWYITKYFHARVGEWYSLGIGYRYSIFPYRGVVRTHSSHYTCRIGSCDVQFYARLVCKEQKQITWNLCKWYSFSSICCCCRPCLRDGT